MNIPDSVHELIATGPLAHLTTLNPDGSPQVTVIWVGIENEEFVIGHMGAWQKVKNMRRDSRMVLSMLGKGKNPMGCRNILSPMGTLGLRKEGLLCFSNAWRPSILVLTSNFHLHPIATILATLPASPQAVFQGWARGTRLRGRMENFFADSLAPWGRGLG